MSKWSFFEEITLKIRLISGAGGWDLNLGTSAFSFLDEVGFVSFLRVGSDVRLFSFWLYAFAGVTYLDFPNSKFP